MSAPKRKPDTRIAVERRAGQLISFTWRGKKHKIDEIIRSWETNRPRQGQRQYYRVRVGEDQYTIYQTRTNWHIVLRKVTRKG